MKIKYCSILLLLIFTSCAGLKKILETSQRTEIDKLTQDIKKVEIGKEADVNLPVSAVKLSDAVAFQKINQTKAIKKYCDLINRKFKKYKWSNSHCEETKWEHVRYSVLGTPLIWTVFGNEESLKTQITKNKPVNMTMILCGVHGDEITPVKFCFDIIQNLKRNPSIISENDLVIVAPIVNPDSFFKRKPTRTNARGVDINRNFPTKDWYSNARKMWKSRYRKDKRRNPGKKSMSEPEVLFQVNLMKRYKPKKVLSVHAPLTLLDYDGPIFSSRTKPTAKTEFAKNVLLGMSEKAEDYKITDYPFFPGSLGNYAGNERKIPTYTLELPNSDWHKTDRYWKKFKPAIHYAIQEKMAPLEKEMGTSKSETNNSEVLSLEESSNENSPEKATN